MTRRRLLGGAGGALLAASLGRAPLAAALQGSGRARLAPPGADVWARSLAVHGSPAGAKLTADGSPVATSAGGGGFEAQVPVGPGPTTVSLTLPGRATAALSETYTGRLADRPTARATLSVGAGEVRLDASPSTPDPYSQAPIESVSWSLRDGPPLGSGPVLSLRGPFQDGEQYVVASVRDAAGRTDQTTIVFVVAGGQPAAVDLSSWQAEWVDGAIVYGAIPPLFGEPPLQALGESLDRLAALGVNVLWLAPLFATERGDFGYAVTDYFSVRPDYGDLADLQALVAAAHDRGIRVILDLPLNDTSWRHPYFQQARSVGPESHYWGFYERSVTGRATHYFNWRNLPNLDYQSAEVRALAVEASCYWLREANVDGFRCDAAWGVQQRAPDFWAQWRAQLLRIRPDLLLLAESSARQEWPALAGFAAAYDWTEELGQPAWKHVFGDPRQVSSRLSRELSIADGTRPFRFLENNDTGLRFISRHGPDMTRAAAAVLLSLPGIPCIYTGQEIGAEYEPYQRVAPLDWDADPHELEAYYRRLIEERAALPALASGSLALLPSRPAGRVIAYLVRGASSAEIVAVNFSGEHASAVIEGAGSRVALQVPRWSAVRLPVEGD